MLKGPEISNFFAILLVAPRIWKGNQLFQFRLRIESVQ